jgi:hypothetical protein
MRFATSSPASVKKLLPDSDGEAGSVGLARGETDLASWARVTRPQAVRSAYDAGAMPTHGEEAGPHPGDSHAHRRRRVLP